MSSSIASYLIDALGDRGKTGGRKTYYIHVSAGPGDPFCFGLADLIQASVTSMFSKEGGWPFGEVRDTDAIYEKEKQIEAGNPVRDVRYCGLGNGPVQMVTFPTDQYPSCRKVQKTGRYEPHRGNTFRLSVFLPTS
jgi:hypothetical protein